MTHTLKIADQNFILHPSGSMYWEEESILLISDVHLGKVSHFRKHGAAVPLKAVMGNFELLNASVSHFNPHTIYFLGDLFHSHLNSEWHYFEEWANKLGPEIILVTGNHDIISPLRYEALDIQCTQEITKKGFLFTHHPEIRKGYYNFCGHIHPAVRIKGRGKQSLRLACFFKGEHQLILPAFGEFTGSHTMKPKKNDEIFALADAMVIKI